MLPGELFAVFVACSTLLLYLVGFVENVTKIKTLLVISMKKILKINQ